MLEVKFTTQFKKDYKQISKNNNYKIEELRYIVDKIAEQEVLPRKYKNHLLSGEYLRIL